jgi:hypothetical protein
VSTSPIRGSSFGVGNVQGQAALMLQGFVLGSALGIGLAGTRLSPLIDGRWIGRTRDRSVGSFDP